MNDLIIIGAGPGGYRTYVHSGSFAEARERLQAVVPGLRAGVEGILSHPNITLVKEKAEFVDAKTVMAATSGETWIADNIVVATGSESKMIPVPGIDGPNVLDSTGLLNLDTLPRKLCIIGAGVIGMEFASVFSRFGTQVTVIEFLKECLPALDGDIAKRLRKQMEKEGIAFNMQCGVKEIADGKVFFDNKKGQTESVEADVILVATGRKPRVQADFAKSGFAYDERKGIQTDENFETTVKGVYAIGDVNGRQMLAHAAEMQGIRVVNRILGKEDGIRLEVMPAAIFTEPEAACVGPSEDQLKADGVQFECHKAFYRANGKAMSMGKTEGMVKLCCEPGEGKLLSAHVYGAHAADLVQEVTAYITLGATLRQLRETVHIHPTLSEVLIEVN